MREISEINERCEFCCELQGQQVGRFHEIYKGILRSRVIRRSKSFSVFPTLGQLLPGSLLIAPNRHVERFSDLSNTQLEEFEEIFRSLMTQYQFSKHSLLFEHGTRIQTNGGCGVYHAHFHLIPVAQPIFVDELLSLPHIYHDSVLDALGYHAHLGNYLVLRDTANRVISVDEMTMKNCGVGSQFMRKVLVQHLNLNKAWDWRTYESPELDVIECVQRMEKSHVS